MKLQRSFFITFLVMYLIIGYFSQMVVGIKWDESATLTTRFLTRAKIAIIDGWGAKVIIALICAVISQIISNRRLKI